MTQCLLLLCVAAVWLDELEVSASRGARARRASVGLLGGHGPLRKPVVHILQASVESHSVNEGCSPAGDMESGLLAALHTASETSAAKHKNESEDGSTLGDYYLKLLRHHSTGN